MIIGHGVQISRGIKKGRFCDCKWNYVGDLFPGKKVGDWCGPGKKIKIQGDTAVCSKVCDVGSWYPNLPGHVYGDKCEPVDYCFKKLSKKIGESCGTRKIIKFDEKSKVCKCEPDCPVGGSCTAYVEQPVDEDEDRQNSDDYYGQDVTISVPVQGHYNYDCECVPN